MNRTPCLILLIVLSGLWVLLGMINGFVLPMVFAAYSKDPDPSWMLAGSIAMLVIFPTSCAITATGGWRLFIGENYALAWKVALIPVPIMFITGFLLDGGLP